jgi:amino acid transporter
MVRTVLISTAAGFFIYAIFSMAIPHGIKGTLEQNESPIIYLFRFHFGSFVAVMMELIAFIAFLSALIANVAVCTRLIYSLSRDKMLPGWQVLQRVNTRTRTPLYVIALVGVIALILNLASAGIVTRIVSIVGVTYYATYVLTMGGAIWADRHNRIPQVPQGSGYMDLGKWLTPVAAFGIAFALFIMAYLTLPKVNHTAGEYSIYALAVGIVWWAVYLRPKLSKGEAGPPPEALSLAESGDELAIASESARDWTERASQ